MGVVAPEGLHKAAAAAAMLVQYRWFLCVNCVCEILAGKFSPQKTKVSDPPLSRRSMNHDAMTKFSASVATAASASASATASAAPAWANASSVSKNRPVSVEDYRGSSSSSTAPPPQSTIRGGTGMDELLAPVSTLDEPVMETIMRDVRAVGAKLRAVLIPLDRHVSV